VLEESVLARVTHLESKPLEEPTTLDAAVRLAASGDQGGWTWIVEHVSPLLELQARYRLSKLLRRVYDVDDLVSDVWMVAFRRLPELDLPAPGAGNALIRFLCTVLIHRVNDAVRKHLQRGSVQKELALRDALKPDSSSSALRALTTSVFSQAARSEARRILGERIACLRPDEQELIVLHGLEGVPNAELARRWGEPEGTVAARYQRALAKLRHALPASLFLEIERA